MERRHDQALGSLPCEEEAGQGRDEDKNKQQHGEEPDWWRAIRETAIRETAVREVTSSEDAVSVDMVSVDSARVEGTVVEHSACLGTETTRVQQDVQPAPQDGEDEVQEDAGILCEYEGEASVAEDEHGDDADEEDVNVNIEQAMTL